MILGINHIGIAVNSIDETLKTLKEIFDAKELSREEYPELGQTSSIVQIGDDLFELMEPIGDVGVVPKFLSQRGQGLHHISLLSSDVKEECEKISAAGVRIMGDPESDLHMVFTHPKDSGGIIYEITDIPFSKDPEN